MDMPASVKVGPYVYTIVQDEVELRRHERDANGALRGCTDHQALIINVDSKMAAGMQRQTLWHEVKHAIIDCLSASDDKRTDESWIGRTTPLELAVLRDNPDLVAYLLATETL